MTTRYLIDSNILIYFVDAEEEVKRARAEQVLRVLAGDRSACVTTQSLGEFFRIATGRIPQPLSEREAADHVDAWREAWPVLGTSVHTLVEQLRGRLRHRLSWWDAQQWAVARVNSVPVVLSEDFTDGQTIEGVTFVDPFAEGFEVGALTD